MVDIQSAAAEIRRGKKKKEEQTTAFHRATINQSTFGEVTSKYVDCLTRSVRLSTEPGDRLTRPRSCARGKKQLLLTVVALILTWLRYVKLVQTDFDLSTDTISDWLNGNNHVQRILPRSIFLCMVACANSHLFRWLLGICTVSQKCHLHTLSCHNSDIR